MFAYRRARVVGAGAGWRGGGRIHRLLALLVWLLATHPFRDGAPAGGGGVGGGEAWGYSMRKNDRVQCCPPVPGV